MEIKEKLEILASLQRQIAETKQGAFAALFRSIPNLTSLLLQSEYEYDDSNYVPTTRIKKINSHRIEDLSNIEIGLGYVEKDSAEYKAVLVEWT